MNSNNDISKELVVNIDGMNISVTGRRKLRICIGIPIGGGINHIFFHNMLLRMEEWSQTFDIMPVIEAVTPVDEARNRIAKVAIENKCDYVFYIDSDVLIQKGQLEKLVSWEKDAITGIYYMRAFPYYPLIRKKSSDRLYSAIEPNGNELISIDGAGFGCFLLKTSVFEKLEYPWFQFKYFKRGEEWRQLSEDLYFCEQLEKAKINIFCDPAIQCIHTGTDVTLEMANRYKDTRLSILDEVKKSKEELSEFTGKSVEFVSERCFISKDIVANQYINDIVIPKENPRKFYKENKDYIFYLVNRHVEHRRIYDIELVNEIKNKYPNARTILDFGSGCGQNTIMLAKEGYDVSMTDFDGYTSSFAKFRVNKRGLNIKFYDIEMPIDKKFDIILALEVLDHIPDDEFENTIYLLKNLKYNGGKILTTIDFGNKPDYPMRYNSSPEKIKLIEELIKG